MADQRWFPLEAYRDAMLSDLDLAVGIWARHAIEGTTRIEQKAFQKSLQDAFSSFEQAALYVLSLADEPRPTGERSHEHLLVMVTRASARRPALAPDLLRPLRELRAFRHLAMHGYVEFEMDRAAPSVDAARRLLADMPAAFDRFGREFGLLPQAG